MGLMRLKDPQPGLEQRLHIGVFDVRDEGIRHQINHRLVIAQLVLGIALVKSRPPQRRQFGDLRLGPALQALAQEIVLRLRFQLRQQRQA